MVAKFEFNPSCDTFYTEILQQLSPVVGVYAYFYNVMCIVTVPIY